MYFKIKVKKFLISALFALGMTPGFASASLVDVDLTAGIWNISAIDDSGLIWDGSTLVFETQAENGDELPLTGYFDWIGSNGAFGRENFTGTLFSDRTIELMGFEIVQPSFGIITANYFAILTDLGTMLINGSWDGSGIPSDDWSATLQSVPLPATLWLFVAGVVGFSVILKKRET